MQILIQLYCVLLRHDVKTRATVNQTWHHLATSVVNCDKQRTTVRDDLAASVVNCYKRRTTVRDDLAASVVNCYKRRTTVRDDLAASVVNCYKQRTTVRTCCSQSSSVVLTTPNSNKSSAKLFLHCNILDKLKKMGEFSEKQKSTSAQCKPENRRLLKLSSRSRKNE